jgi:hypothetical protein
MLQKGVDLSVKMMMSENQSNQSQVHVKAFRGTEASLNRRCSAYTCEGAWFSPNTSHVIQKRTVNSTLAMGHQADPAHCYEFHSFKDEFAIHKTINKPGSISGDTLLLIFLTQSSLISALLSKNKCCPPLKKPFSCRPAKKFPHAP